MRISLGASALTLAGFLGLGALLACGGGGGGTSTPPPADPWAPVTAAIQADLSAFPNGICVEVATPQGVVYSHSFGGMTNSTFVPVASASKWVSSTVILRLVDQGVFPHGLDTTTSELLVDSHTSQPWSGNMGAITLRNLLSFTSGISGNDTTSEQQLPLSYSLGDAVQAIYDDDAATAKAPGSYFYYGATHLRIAARMAEVATGKSWAQIFKEQVHDPMGWDATSIFDTNHPTCQNPDPAGDLTCDGLDYMRFVMMELRNGQDNGAAFLAPATWTAQRTDGFGPSTVVVYSPADVSLGKNYHYALGNWIGTADGNPESPSNPPTWFGSTGTFGWAPWVAADGSYGAIIETKQSNQGQGGPSEDLKAVLDPLIRQALAQNPPVIRTVP
ncbi:MAG TPA: serine hydrolase [Holophagaceae bacterium]|nr:serine hydrolase [Holophagaceae bacterium]